MKRFQSIIQNYITNHQKHKKYLAGVLALSVLVSFGVSAGLIEPAVSWSGDDVVLYNDNIRTLANEGGQMLPNYAGADGNRVNGETYSPSQMSVKDLLIGAVAEGDKTLAWADGCNDADSIIAAAENTYFLGIAYDFCVFLEGNMEITDADAEGRVAVGGNIIKPSGGNYQIGAGDFGTNTPLKNTDNYVGISNFAHAIANGYIKRIDTYGTKNGGGKAVDYDDDFFKRLIIGDYDNSIHRNDSDAECSYSGTHDHYLLKSGSNDWITNNPISDGNEASQLYMQPDNKPLINFTEVFVWLRNQSEALQKKVSIPGVVSGNTVTFTVPSTIKEGDTVYFSLPSWQGEDGCEIENVYFNFEDTENPPVKRDGLILKEDGYDEPLGSWSPTCNIVVNCGGTGYQIGNSKKLTNTYVNGLPISNRPAGIHESVENVFDRQKATNNRLASEKILYNFYEAKNLSLKGNFNGTVFAPNADVKSDTTCDGHLSGALIAKSFKGGMEFGYRPYRGTSDILGGKSGYGVPIKKIIEGENTALPGATFGVYEKNDDGSVSDSYTPFTTDDNGEAYVNIESKVDFTGGTDYKTNNAITKHYVIKEVKAPAGFVTDNTQEYEITVTETVDIDSIKNINGNDIPTTVTTVIKQGDKTFTIKLHDIYSYEGGTYKRIMRELETDDGNNRDNFQIQISTDGKVTSVRSGIKGDETITQYTPTEDTEWVISDKTVTKELPVYLDSSENIIYKLDENYKYVDGKFFTDGFTVEDGKIYKDGKTVKNKNEADNTFAEVQVSDYSDNVQYVSRNTENVLSVANGEGATIKTYSVEKEIDNLVYKFSDNSYIHYVDDTWKYVKSDDEEIPVVKKDDKWVYTDDSGGEVIINSDDNQPTSIAIESWGGNNSNKTAYTIGCLAWNCDSYPKVDELTFYYTDGTYQTIDNVSVGSDSNWHKFNLGNLSTANVIGVKVVTSGDVEINGDNPKLCIQHNEWKNIDGWGEVKNATGTIRTGATPATHTETIDVPETEKVSMSMLDAYQAPVLTTTSLYLLKETIFANEAAQTAQDYKSISSNISYKYDPETMMMMPQPATENTQKFTNKRGLIFKKVSQLGTADPAPLKGATINVKLLTDWGTGDDANKPIGNEITGMKNILAGDSETTVDVLKLTEGATYYFEETATPDNTKYEFADPIYFRRSDNTIYYTKDADKAKSDNTNGWDSVDIAKKEYIEMVDIQISGAKIKLGKYRYANGALTTDRLSGAEFILKAYNGDVIYPTDNTSFAIEGTDLDLSAVFIANAGKVNEGYVKNGYLKPGVYVLNETKSPENDSYEKQDFRFQVNDDYTITPLDSDAPVYEPLDIQWGNNNGLAYVKSSDGVLNSGNTYINNVTSLEVKLTDSSEPKVYVDDGLTLNKTFSNGVLSGTFNSATNIKKFEIQYSSWKEGGWDVEYVIITTSDGKTYKYDGNSSGGSGDGTGLSFGVTSDNNSTVTISGALLAEAKKQPDVDFIKVETKNGGQIHINLDSKDDKGQIADTSAGSVSYSLKDIYDLAINKGNAYGLSSTDDITSIRFIHWTSENIIVTPLIEIPTTEPEQPTTTTPAGSDDELPKLPLTIDGDTIKIPNQKPGTNISITVEKVWVDTGFESLRPEEGITVTLKRITPSGTEVTFEGQTKKITEGTDGKWTATWSGLERLVDPNGADEASNWYKYYVEEVPVEGYKMTGITGNNTSTGGTITITNTLDGTDISVTKQWVESDDTEAKANLPESVTVKLQWRDKNSTGAFTDTGKTLELKSPNYTGTFENLPTNKEYQIVEASVPNGWIKLNDGIAENGIITNKRDTGKLTIKKDWEDNNSTSSRPNDIWVAVYRTTENSASGNTVAEAPNFDPDNTSNLYPDYSLAMYKSVRDNTGNTVDVDQYNDYARLLQYSLYFYDANMCGSQAGETSAYDWRDDCHLGADVDGGFHDAGDHTMFGLPQGFTASTLGWSYYEFKDSFDKLGLTDHYKTIMQYFCDFFARCYNESNDTVLVQKGNPGTDQSVIGWASPEGKSDSDYGGDTWVSSGADNIAADYAASLAQYVVNFSEDAEKCDKYLDTAKKLYAHAKNHDEKNGNHLTGYNYNNASDGECKSEMAWASVWLYLATGENTYKDDCVSYLNGLTIPDMGYFYSNVAAGAMCVYGSIDSSYNLTTLKNYLSQWCTGDDYQVINSWGSARHNTLLQTVALSATKNFDGIDYADWCKKQMNIILGKNDGKICLVTGFASNSVKHPHHRAASVTESDTAYAHTLVGALAGGPKGISFSNYPDTVTNYTENEVALDYNAGLVGAAAGLYAVYGTGKTYSNVESGIASQSDEVDTDALNGFTVNNISNATLASESITPDVGSDFATVTKTDNGNGTCTFTFVIPSSKNAQDDGKDNTIKISNLNLENVTSVKFDFDNTESALTCNYHSWEVCPHTEWPNKILEVYNGSPKKFDDLEIKNIKWWSDKNKGLTITCTFTMGEGSGDSGDVTTSSTEPTQGETTTTTTTTANDSTPQGWVTTVVSFQAIEKTEVTRDGLGLKNVRKVVIQYNDNVSGEGQLQIGGQIELPGAEYNDYQPNNAWKISNNKTFEYGDCNIPEINSFAFKPWWLSPGNYSTVNIIFYCEPEGFKITSNKDITIAENGNETITANEDADWSVSYADGSSIENGLVSLNTSDSKNCIVTINGYTDKKIKVTATSKADSTKSDSVEITVNSSGLDVLQNGESVLRDGVKFRAGGTAKITVSPTDGISCEASGVTVTGNNGSYTISGSTPTDNATVTFSRNGKTATVNVQVLGNPVITGSTAMNKNSTQKLEVDNAIGNITWSITGDSSITIDPDGTVHSGATSGVTATVTATDSDGIKSLPFTISIELTAVNPGIPENAQLVTIVKLTPDSNGEWKTELDLPKTDEHGNVYHYYIAEVDKNGNQIEEVVGSSSNIKYLPVNYENNGETLSAGSLTLTVKNEKEPTDENQVTLPVTGGTGTTWYYITGTALMLIPAVILMRRRKKST